MNFEEEVTSGSTSVKAEQGLKLCYIDPRVTGGHWTKASYFGENLNLLGHPLEHLKPEAYKSNSKVEGSANATWVFVV